MNPRKPRSRITLTGAATGTITCEAVRCSADMDMPSGMRTQKPAAISTKTAHTALLRVTAATGGPRPTSEPSESALTRARTTRSFFLRHSSARIGTTARLSRLVHPGRVRTEPCGFLASRSGGRVQHREDSREARDVRNAPDRFPARRPSVFVPPWASQAPSLEARGESGVQM